MPKSYRDAALLAVIAGVLFFVNLGATHLWDVDEAIFAQSAKEMYERGDHVVPTFNGEIFAHKPAMMYWLMISAYELFGPTEFAARFWSAVFGIGSVLLTYRLGRLMFSPAAGFWAGLILASSVNFNVIARAATPDSFLVFFSTLAMLLFVSGTAKARALSGEQNDRNAPWAGQTRFEPSWRSWAMIYGAMAGGFLTKGPIGIVLPTASIGLFLLVMRAVPLSPSLHVGWSTTLRNVGRWLAHVLTPMHVLRTIWSMRPLTAVAMLLLVAGPWYVLVGIKTDGEWLIDFFGVHNFGRFLSAMDNHRGPIFYYLLAIAVGFFPWSILATPSILQFKKLVRENHPWRPGYVLACSWIAVWVGFFSLAGTKLPSYVVPAYPALALFTAGFVASWLREPATLNRVLGRLAWGVVALAGIVLVIALPLAAHLFLNDEWLLGAIGLIPLIAAVVGWRYTERGMSRQAAMTLGSLGCALSLALFGFGAVYVDRYQDSPQFAERIAESTPEGAPAVVGSFHHFRPSYVFYTGGNVALFGSPEEVQAFFAENGSSAFLITNEDQFEKIRSTLPPDIGVLKSQRRLMQRGNVLLLGHVDASTPSAPATATLPADKPAPKR